MPFTIKSRKTIDTPLAAEYRKQIAWHERDKDPRVPKTSPKPLRSFPLVDDTVTISSEQQQGTREQSDVLTSENSKDSAQKTIVSEPVTPAEKNELGIFSIRV